MRSHAASEPLMVHMCCGKQQKTRGVAHSAWSELTKIVNTHWEIGRVWHINSAVWACENVCVHFPLFVFSADGLHVCCVCLCFMLVTAMRCLQEVVR